MKLNQSFTAKLQKSPNKGGWTYVICGIRCNSSGRAAW